jgi:DNA-binding beta-propeller fold protein YncE
MRKTIIIVCALLLQPLTNALAQHHSLLVLSQDDRGLYDLDVSTGKILNQCALAGAPQEALFSWDERTLFVSVPEAGHIAMVDVATFKEKGRIEVGQFTQRAQGTSAAPMALATTDDGRKLYVGVDGGLLVFDSRLLIYDFKFGIESGRKIALGQMNGWHFKIQTTTGKLYYPDRAGNQVVVLDTGTDNILKKLPVQGGPMDVVFAPGDEAWVQSANGFITVINTRNDEVVKTITASAGNGAARIAIAPDARYIASTNADTGETVIIHPIKKEAVATVRTGQGPSLPVFAPELKGTNRLYLVGASGSEVSVVDLSTSTVAVRHKAGKSLRGGLIHYTYPKEWGPPREGTAKKAFENDLFTAYTNAMFNGDVSPVHEHRADFAGVYTSTGIAKIGCWSAKCPPEVVPQGALPYRNSESAPASFAGNTPRGTIHQEEGVSPSPRRAVIFELKNNYYRQTHPPRTQPIFAGAGFRKIGEHSRAIAWDVTLEPGKPLEFPDGDIAVVYLAGGLVRLTQNGKPSIVNRYYSDFDWEPRAHTLEALSNPVRIAIIEFK